MLPKTEESPDVDYQPESASRILSEPRLYPVLPNGAGADSARRVRGEGGIVVPERILERCLERAGTGCLRAHFWCVPGCRCGKCRCRPLDRLGAGSLRVPVQ